LKTPTTALFAMERSCPKTNATDCARLIKKLSTLGPKFGENVLKATNAFELELTTEDDLVGLPESAKEACAAAAEAKGKQGTWLVTLQAPSMIPFLQYSEKRELREKIWKAYSSRAFKDEFSNENTIKEIVSLKYERANLLGFPTHAHYVLDKRMAGNPEKVNAFLQKLLKASKPAAERDLAEVQEFAKSIGGPDTLLPWDFAFYSEKIKEKKFEFSEEDLRPYFKLENVIAGVFEHASKLYGLKFTASTDYPVYHDDVMTYEVYDESSNDFIGLFYADFFPRDSKRGGAWMTTFYEQGLFQGEVMRPHVSIVCNFTKPTKDKPSLLTFMEVQTLFHEFGHSLHGLLSQCKYRSLAGTNVLWDFVELPSQILENWTLEKESLDLFAKHYETGELMPKELAQKIKDSSKFLAGYSSLRQLNFATVDMRWHTTVPDKITSVDEFEAEATKETTLFDKVPGTNFSCAFSHIFAGGYSSGYYSYKWAEVLDADAFEMFKEKGLFDASVAKSFKENILMKGGTEHPMKLYKKFRGREPDPDALLRRDGLI
jgi:peptidyl-dipeptidase Dcp